jgi:tryptophan-rich sensory protein
MADWLTLLPFLIAVGAAAVTGARYMPGPWYERLAKPWWTPPNWLFPPAWAVLYAMIAVAGWFAWRAQGIGPLVAVWTIHLAFNAAWSWIMFGRRQIGLAAVDAVLMWVTIVLFIALAWPVVPAAAWLFVPYLVWVSYALALNLKILQLNGTTAKA